MIPTLHRSVALVFATTLVAAACSVEHQPGGSSHRAPPGDRGGAADACADGDERTCSVELAPHNGVTSCFGGVQRCEDGVWSACGDGLATTSAWQTLAGAQDCPHNPCDPECRQFEGELPDDGWNANGNLGSFSWSQGDPTDVPQGVLDKIHDEPCRTADDCQTNSYCFDPASESCTHDICEAGSGLDASCGSCAERVCDTHPECCQKDAGWPSCGHSECVTGAPLAGGCSLCASSVCDADPACCSGWWGSSCVELAKAEPRCAGLCDGGCSGQACTHDVCTTGSKLMAQCDPCVADVCNADPYCCNQYWDGLCVWGAKNTPTCSTNANGGSQACSHEPCTAGAALEQGCASFVVDVCDVSPSCCTDAWTASCVALFDGLTPGGCPASWAGDWDASCVDAVAGACGATCAPAPSGSGQCRDYAPGQTNTQCDGVDLSVGYTCDDNVPICNHGTQPAPAGLTVMHVPAGSGYFAAEAPPASIPGMLTCTTSTAIAPGHCVDVSCPGLAAGREIMVNPPAGNPAFVAECGHLDNWGVYLPGVCVSPTCATESIKATIKPVNMFITVDKSGSMLGTRWTNTKNAFTSFFGDPGAAGIGIALELFPHDGCYQSSYECGNPSRCSIPHVALGPLTAASAPADTQEKALIDAFGDFWPGGNTPALLALEGCHAWAASYSQAHPDEQQVCILVTDGEPNSCGSATHSFTSVAAAGLAQYGVLTYGIGIVGANQQLLNDIADAGSGEAFFVGSANMEQDLLAALLAIKGEAVGCAVTLPAGQYDPKNAIVTFKPSMGAPVVLPRVADLAACGTGAGWYLDDPDDATSIHLCPASCAVAQADPGGELDFAFPCQGQLQPTEYTAFYEASCPAPQVVQWGYFGYETVAPSTSEVVFDARWADTEPELASAVYKPLATARSTPTDSQLCGLASDCSVDLFTAAGEAPDAHRAWLELRATLHPDASLTSGPSVDRYDITYTCVDLE